MIGTILRLTRSQKNGVLIAVDLLVVPLAYSVAVMIHRSTLWPAGELARDWQFLPLLELAAGALLFWLGLWRVRLKDYQHGAILRSAIFATAMGGVSAILVQLGARDIAPGFHALFALVLFGAYYGARTGMLYLLLSIYRRSAAVSRVAIYGAGRTGMALAQAIRKKSDIVAYAFIDDNATLQGLNVEGLPVYSGARVSRMVRTHKINRVILAMPTLSASKQTFLSQRLESLGVEVQSLPAFARLTGEEALLDKLTPIGPAALLSRGQLDDEIAGGSTAYAGASVLITGAGGSIGQELCRQVIACRPRRLVLLELSELALYTIHAEIRVLAEEAGVELVAVLGSIGDAMLVETVLRTHRIEAVLHAAAYKHVPIVEANIRVGLSNNALGTAVLAQKAREAGVRRFVLVSSDKAVNPGNVMGASKRFAELIVQDLAARAALRPGEPGTIFTIVRFGNVLGSSGSVIPLFQDQIARGGPVTITDMDVTRYFMTIEEAARLVLVAGSFAEGGEVYVLDMGKPVRIRDLACRLIEASGYTVRSKDNPDGDIELVCTGLRPGEKLHEELFVRQGGRSTAHPKIMQVREDCLSEIEMAAALRALREGVEQGSDQGVLMALARAVPEYDPQSQPQDALPARVVRPRRRKAEATPAE